MEKVAVLLPGLGTSGIESLFRDLSLRWDRERFDIIYLLPVNVNLHQFWEDDIRSNGIKVYHLGDLHKRNLLRWPGRLYRALRQYGPFDVIHSNMDMMNGLNLKVAKRAGIPIRISHVHASSIEGDNSVSKRLYNSLMRRMMLRNGTRLLACSDLAGKYFYINSPYEIVMNGINLKPFIEQMSCKNHQKWRFITVGVFSETKNPFFLLEVFTKIQRMVPEATLTWVGKGVLKNKVQQQAIETGIFERITWMEDQKNIARLLHKHDFFLFPSLSEGLGIALIEAQAAGLDCFISDTIPEMSNCGKCKILSLQNSAQDWAKEIVSYVRSGQRMEIDSNKMARFDIDLMATRLMSIYDGREEYNSPIY